MDTNTQSNKIRVDDAVRLFGSKAELSRVFGITPQALTIWGEYVPELRVYRLRDSHPIEADFLMKQAGSK